MATSTLTPKLVTKNRLSRGWTQTMLANKAGLAPVTIHRMERGVKSRLVSFRAVSKVFKEHPVRQESLALTPAAKPAATPVPSIVQPTPYVRKEKAEVKKGDRVEELMCELAGLLGVKRKKISLKIK